MNTNGNDSAPVLRGGASRALLAAAGCALLALTLLAGYGVRVLAEGAPLQQPLFYSGNLEADGALANGDFAIKLSLYASASGGKAVCTAEGTVPVQNGRFRMDASTCVDAVAAEPDVWLAVSFTGPDGIERAIEGRSKVGAVPYALQAQHAVTASAVAPGGTLSTALRDLSDRLDKVEAVTIKSGFLAYKTQDQALGTGYNKIFFENEVFDLGGEYDPKTGIFKANEDGHYEFSCTVGWDQSAHTNGTWEISLQVDGFERTYNGWYGDGQYATRSLTATIDLKAGQGVYCATLHDTAEVNANLGNDKTFSTFSGHRI